MDNKNRLLEMNINTNPVRVELELTEQCNLECKFCYNSQNPIISKKIPQIIEKLVENNVLEIILTGGEPLLHPDFELILKKCSGLFSKVMVQTNGTLIDDNIINLLVENNVYGMNISLHGFKEYHEELTGINGSFEPAFEALSKLIKSKIKVASNFVITKKNVQILDKFIDYLYEIGLREMTLTRFNPTGIGKSNMNLEISNADLINALYKVNEKKKLYKDMNIILANSIPYCALPSELKYFCEYCHFGTSRFYVDVEGNLMMCGMSRIKIGNILEKPIKEIKHQSSIYCNHVLGNSVPEKCKKCNHFTVCRGGCRAAAFAYTNSIAGIDPLAISKLDI